MIKGEGEQDGESESVQARKIEPISANGIDALAGERAEFVAREGVEDVIVICVIKQTPHFLSGI